MENIVFSFPESVEAKFDCWFLGDKFLKTTHNAMQIAINAMMQNKKLPQMYLHEFYNTKPLCNPDRHGNLLARIVNSLLEECNTTHHLPRFLVVMIDKDLITDLDVYDRDIVMMIRDVVNWLTRQINILIHHKRAKILECRPSAIYGADPSIIYVQMIRRADLHLKRGSKLDENFALRAKFNDA